VVERRVVAQVPRRAEVALQRPKDGGGRRVRAVRPVGDEVERPKAKRVRALEHPQRRPARLAGMRAAPDAGARTRTSWWRAAMRSQRSKSSA
jgi:hypothetical protein